MDKQCEKWRDCDTRLTHVEESQKELDKKIDRNYSTDKLLVILACIGIIIQLLKATM